MNTRSISTRTAYLLIAGAACIWGTLGLFVRALTEAGFTQTQLIAVRGVLSAIVMTVYLALREPALLKVRVRDLWMFAGTGIVSFDLFTLCYFHAVGMIPLSTAAILLYTAPIFVAVLSVLFFHERFTKRKLICLAMAFGGCVLVSGFSGSGGGSESGLGIVLGVLSGLFYGLYSIFGQAALRRYHTLTIITYTFIVASIGIVPFAGLDRLGEVHWTAAVGCELVVFAVATGAAAYLLYTLGMSRVRASNAAIAAILEPVVATLLGAAVYGETLGIVGITGVVLVVLAVLLLSAPQKNPAPKRVS